MMGVINVHVKLHEESLVSLSVQVVCMLQYSLRTPGPWHLDDHKKVEL